MIKGIIFDLYGVLVRTEDPAPRHAWDERLGLPTGSVERAVHYSDIWVQAQLGRIMPKAFWNGVAELLYAKRDILPELRADFYRGDRIDYRLVNLLQELRKNGLPLVLLCNHSIELERRLAELEVAELFDHVLISALIGVMKPDPTAFKVALQAINALPQEAIFIDASRTHIRAAQMLGLHTILFRPELDLRAEIERIVKQHAGE